MKVETERSERLALNYSASSGDCLLNLHASPLPVSHEQS